MFVCSTGNAGVGIISFSTGKVVFGTVKRCVGLALIVICRMSKTLQFNVGATDQTSYFKVEREWFLFCLFEKNSSAKNVFSLLIDAKNDVSQLTAFDLLRRDFKVNIAQFYWQLNHFFLQPSRLLLAAHKLASAPFLASPCPTTWHVSPALPAISSE